MVISRANGKTLALTAVALSSLTACASTHGPTVARVKTPRTPITITQTYETVSSTVPVGTAEEEAVAALETKGWDCWGYAVADSSIRDTRSGELLKGSVMTCQVLRGNEMNPLARKYTAQLLFEKDKLAGIQIAQRHNAF